MKFTIRHPYAIEPDAFWRELFFDAEYNRKLYLEGLRFEGFEVLEETNPPDGRRTRKVHVKPRFEAPAARKAHQERHEEKEDEEPAEERSARGAPHVLFQGSHLHTVLSASMTL